MPHTLSVRPVRSLQATSPAGPSACVHADIAAHVRRETTVYQHDRTHFRRWGVLNWLENPWQTSLESRLFFISALVSHIKNKSIQKDQPLTFLSLGSGGLLTECYIHRLLFAEGYEHVHWRFIDVSYRHQNLAVPLEEFKQKTGAMDALAFISEQDYLKSEANGYGLASNDRNRGTTVVLSINSPEDLNSRYLHADDADCERFRPTRLQNAAAANCLFFILSHEKHRKYTDKTLLTAPIDSKLMVGNNILRCAVNQNHQLKIKYCASDFGKHLYDCLRPYLNDLLRQTAKGDKSLTLEEVDKIGDLMAKALSGNSLYLAKYFASDYDISLENLRQYSQEGTSSLFAALDWNEARFD